MGFRLKIKDGDRIVTLDARASLEVWVEDDSPDRAESLYTTGEGLFVALGKKIQAETDALVAVGGLPPSCGSGIRPGGRIYVDTPMIQERADNSNVERFLRVVEAAAKEML